jgi:hypothetical protein
MKPTPDTVYLQVKGCWCRGQPHCFHHKALVVLRRFQNGRLLVSNGACLRAVDPQQVGVTPP